MKDIKEALKPQARAHRVWYKIETPEKCVTKAICLPLPMGPYFLVHQHEVTQFEKNPNSIEIQRLKEFSISWGYATYCIDENLVPLMVGQYFDTSD